MPDPTQQPHLYERLRALTASGQNAKGLFGFLQNVLNKSDLQSGASPATPAIPAGSGGVGPAVPATPPINAALPTDNPSFRLTGPGPSGLTFSDAFKTRAQAPSGSIMPPPAGMPMQPQDNVVPQLRAQTPTTGGVGRFTRG